MWLPGDGARMVGQVGWEPGLMLASSRIEAADC